MHWNLKDGIPKPAIRGGVWFFSTCTSYFLIFLQILWVGGSFGKAWGWSRRILNFFHYFSFFEHLNVKTFGFLQYQYKVVYWTKVYKKPKQKKFLWEVKCAKVMLSTSFLLVGDTFWVVLKDERINFTFFLQKIENYEKNQHFPWKVAPKQRFRGRFT